MHRFSVRSGERAGVIERYLVYCLHSRHPTSLGTTSIISFRGIRGISRSAFASSSPLEKPLLRTTVVARRKAVLNRKHESRLGLFSDESRPINSLLRSKKLWPLTQQVDRRCLRERLSAKRNESEENLWRKFEMLDPAASQTELRNQFHIENVLNN